MGQGDRFIVPEIKRCYASLKVVYSRARSNGNRIIGDSIPALFILSKFIAEGEDHSH